MSKTPNLKPCQIVAKALIQWRYDYITQRFIGRIDCKECDRHAKAEIDRYILKGDCLEYTKGRLLHELCKGCKGVSTDEKEVPDH